MAAFSDEVLMAFADDELDSAARADVEAAMRDDPEIRRRVESHRALRARVRLAYSAELEEAPPERLLAAARAPGADSGGRASVTKLSDARAAATAAGTARAASKAARTARVATNVRWRPLASMAASLVIGVVVGYGVLRQSSSIITQDGGLVAGGALARALSGQLGGDRPAGASVQLGLSFMAKSGDYCRVFTLAGGAAPSGVACHRDAQWRIDVLAQHPQGDPAASPDNYRTAGSALSPAILGVVQERISGEPLDPAAEALARQRGWQGPAR